MGYLCVCEPGYTGVNCDVDINECSPDPCTNGATCQVYRALVYYVRTFIFSYFCLFHGLNIFFKLRHVAMYVADNICPHAQDQVNAFMCQCLPGFYGIYCETDEDECVSSPCVNGVCVVRTRLLQLPILRIYVATYVY